MVNLARKQGIPLSFETDRLFVRRYVLADARHLYEAARESIREVHAFLPWCHPNYAIEDSRDWIRSVEPAWQDRSVYSFAIYDTQRSRLLGGCGVSRLDEHPVMNLGYWMRTSETSKGYASEATLGLANFAFRWLDVERIEIIMSTENTASRKVAENAGASYEGQLARRLKIHQRMHDAYLYSLTRPQLTGDPP